MVPHASGRVGRHFRESNTKESALDVYFRVSHTQRTCAMSISQSLARSSTCRTSISKCLSMPLAVSAECPTCHSSLQTLFPRVSHTRISNSTGRLRPSVLLATSPNFRSTFLYVPATRNSSKQFLNRWIHIDFCSKAFFTRGALGSASRQAANCQYAIMHRAPWCDCRRP